MARVSYKVCINIKQVYKVDTNTKTQTALKKINFLFN